MQIESGKHKRWCIWRKCAIKLSISYMCHYPSTLYDFSNHGRLASLPRKKYDQFSMP